MKLLPSLCLVLLLLCFAIGISFTVSVKSLRSRISKGDGIDTCHFGNFGNNL